MSITFITQTFSITLNAWNNLLSNGYQGFDPAFDCKVLNFDEDITDLNYVLQVETSDEQAIKVLSELN